METLTQNEKQLIVLTLSYFKDYAKSTHDYMFSDNQIKEVPEIIESVNELLNRFHKKEI